jgi:surfactin synthase thioesterase subunit
MRPDPPLSKGASSGTRHGVRFTPGRAALKDSVTLFAFPHAGGPARAFDGLARCLPPKICLRAAELPGHGSRIGEPLVRDMAALAQTSARAIRAAATPRFVLLGHSFGGSLAFATAAELAGQPGRQPEALILCGTNPPDSALLQAADLASLAGPGRLPQDPDLRRAFMGTFGPVISADLTALAGFRHSMEARPIQLTLPFHICTARNDTLAPAERAPRWQAHTTQPANTIVVDGDHFFVQSSPQPLAEQIVRILASATQPIA